MTSSPRRFLRFCYWLGIIVDGYAAIRLIIVRISGDGTPETIRAAGIGAALMVGWTILLIWALRKPIERIGVLVITVIPVLILLLANQLLSIITYGIITNDEILNLVILLVLTALFSLAIWLNISKPVQFAE